MLKRSSGLQRTPGSLAGAAASRPSPSIQPSAVNPMAMRRTEGGSCAFSTSARLAGDTNTVCAPLSASIAATCAGVSSPLTGTMQAPALTMPNITCSISSELVMTSATGTSCPAPKAMSAFATRLVPESNSAQLRRRSPQIAAVRSGAKRAWVAQISVRLAICGSIIALSQASAASQTASHSVTIHISRTPRMVSVSI